MTILGNGGGNKKAQIMIRYIYWRSVAFCVLLATPYNALCDENAEWPNLTVMGVVGEGSNASAIIDGHLLRVGDQIYDTVLVSIENRLVRLRYNEEFRVYDIGRNAHNIQKGKESVVQSEPSDVKPIDAGISPTLKYYLEKRKRILEEQNQAKEMGNSNISEMNEGVVPTQNDREEEREVMLKVQSRPKEIGNSKVFELDESLKYYQMDIIRAKGHLGAPLSFVLTKEMDDQLVTEGILPKRDDVTMTSPGDVYRYWETNVEPRKITNVIPYVIRVPRMNMRETKGQSFE